MEFFQITQSNAGRYYCVATNPNGNVTKTAEVIVHHNEIPDRNVVQGRVQEVYEGEAISLECTEPKSPNARVRKNPFFFCLFLPFLSKKTSRITLKLKNMNCFGIN